MSPIYVGFCVMKCAFIAMFASVCKIVNFLFFFFLVRIFPTRATESTPFIFGSHGVIFLPLPFLAQRHQLI